MCIGNNGRLSVDIAADEVCCFSAYTGQRGQLFDGIGNNAVKIGQNLLRHTYYICRLCTVKAAGVNQLFDIADIGRCIVLQGFVLGKKCRGYKIYTCVGTLCGKPCCDKKLKRVACFKRTD